MSYGVIDGSSVDAANTNVAFIVKNDDDSTTHKLGLQSTAVGDGPLLYTSTQKAINTLDTTTGATETVPGTTYSAPASTIVDGTNHQVALTALANKFDPTTGHIHSGAAGDAPPVSAPTISGVPLRGVVEQGTDILAVTGVSSDVSAQFASKTASTGTLSLGVVVLPIYNKCVLRQASGASTGDKFIDGSGNEVYARITNSGATWTLTYYVDLAGVETSYNFTVSSDIRFYYQELFNPMVSIPTYSEFATIPSDNVTADIITATTTDQGKVSLATTAQSIGSSNSAGTANASVANANHVHQGVHSVAVTAPIYGDAVLVAGTGISMSQLGQNITIDALATPGGADKDVQFNDGGSALGGDSTFTFNKTTKVMTVADLIHDPAYTSTYWGIATHVLMGDSAIVSADAFLMGSTDLNTGAASAVTADIGIQTGDNNLTNPTGKTGDIWVNTGWQNDTGSTGVTGLIDMTTGANSGAGASGAIDVHTGATSGGATGTIAIRSGNTSGANPTGNASIKSGSNTGAGVSGSVTVTTGPITGGANSGSAYLTTGAVSGSGNSGAISINTGNVLGGNSGNIDIISGISTGGNSGNISISTNTAGVQRGQIVLGGPVVYYSGSSGALGGGFTINPNSHTYLQISAAGNVTSSAGTAITAGVQTGQLLVLHNISAFDITIKSGAGVQTPGGIDYTINANSTMTLIFATVWVTLATSSN